MSVRPSARADGRKKMYKWGVDAEDARRKHEDNMAGIPKNKREENLLGMPSPQTGVPDKKLENLPAMVINGKQKLSKKEMAEKRQRRIINNRMSATNSRKKKKVELQDLEKRVETLKEECEILRRDISEYHDKIQMLINKSS